MSKLLKVAISVLVVVVVLTMVGWLFFRGAETANQRDFPPYVKTYAYGLGMLRIRDTDAQVNLFSYHEDGRVKPLSIEKDGNRWVVVFEEHKR
jgi:flagellar basal body-associated protein FliL